MGVWRSGCRSLTQDFNVYDPTSGTELGSIEGNETIASLFGLTNTEFTAASVDPPGAPTRDGRRGIGLRRVQPGRWYENVTPRPQARHGTVTDTLVTPSGHVNLDSLLSFNAADPLNPGDAFTGST